MISTGIKNNMKILFYIPNVKFDDNTGDSIHSKELALSLSTLGNDLIIIAQIKNKFTNSNNMELKKVNGVYLPGLKHFSLEIFGFLKGLWTCIISKPDVIYRRQEMFWFSNIFYKFFRVPVITEINGMVVDEAILIDAGIRMRILKKIYPLIELQSLNLSRKVVIVTDKLKEIIQETYGIDEEKLIVIQNGANTDLFRPVNTKYARQKLGMHNKNNYVSFVGYLAPWQGVEYLIQAAHIVLEKLPETYFLVVGDGPMKSEWRELAEKLGIANSFIFTGSVPYKDVPLYINSGNLCVVPKKLLMSGYSPLKLYEYMACGRPVIATKTYGFEVIEEKKAGLLIDPEDSYDFAEKIMSLLQNKELSFQMGANGRKYVVENHSWESVARRVAQVCKQAIEETS